MLHSDYFYWLLIIFVDYLLHLEDFATSDKKCCHLKYCTSALKILYILPVANVSFISSWNICVCEYNLSTLLYSLITIIFPSICREKKSTFFSKHVSNEISHLKILEGYNLSQNRMTNNAVNLNLIVNLFLECSNVSKHTPLK